MSRQALDALALAVVFIVACVVLPVLLAILTLLVVIGAAVLGFAELITMLADEGEEVH